MNELYKPGLADVVTCINTKLLRAIDVDQFWLNHCGQPLFPISNKNEITITNPSNLIYNDNVMVSMNGTSLLMRLLKMKTP